MVVLNQIIYELCYGHPPIIQRSDGLYELATNVTPATTAGTNLIAWLEQSDKEITLLGSWSTNSYYYESDGTWHQEKM